MTKIITTNKEALEELLGDSDVTAFLARLPLELTEQTEKEKQAYFILSGLPVSLEYLQDKAKTLTVTTSASIEDIKEPFAIRDRLTDLIDFSHTLKGGAIGASDNFELNLPTGFDNSFDVEVNPFNLFKLTGNIVELYNRLDFKAQWEKSSRLQRKFGEEYSRLRRIVDSAGDWFQGELMMRRYAEGNK